MTSEDLIPVEGRPGLFLTLCGSACDEVGAFKLDQT